MIHLIKSTFYKEKETKRKLLTFINNAKYLSFGNECLKFEKKFSNYQDRKYCVFVNSGSSANLALIQALLNLGRLKKGDEVGFSALTWSTNVMPLLQLGLAPVPIDVELDTLNVSSNTLKNKLKKHNIKAMFTTNILGLCDDIDNIQNVCKEKKIIFLEDNCESLGTIYKGKKLGNYGLASTFSFYVGHHMSTIEGGAICTDNAALAEQLRIVRAHGWDRNLSEKRQNKIRDKFKVNSTFYSRYTFYNLGYNLRPTEINGFIGNMQIDYINEIVNKRKDNFIQIASAIYNHNNYFPIEYDHIDLLSSFAIPLICKSKKIRDELVKKCEGKIEIRPIVGGDITNQPFFKKFYPDYVNLETNAKIAHEQGFYVGNNPELTKKEVEDIIRLLT